MTEVIWTVIMYICGSIPFSFIIPYWVKGVDVRKVGSGNVGATNAFRVSGWKVAIMCIVMDCCKVLVPLVILQLAFHPEKPLLFASSIAGVVGHDFSIFLRFRSGKGVASTMGVFFALNPIAGSIFLGSSLLLFAKTRLVSLSTMSGMVLATISSLFLFSDLSYFFLFLGLTLLSIFRHKKNIQRLIKGEEKRLTEKKKNP